MNATIPFADRQTAGRALGDELKAKNYAEPVVLALPRGGVPVAAEIARALNAPLDLVLVRKIGVPYQRELAAAAVVDGSQPEIVVNDDVLSHTGIDKAYIDHAAKRELAEIERRRRVYLGDRPRIPLEGRTLIVVDDGIATGASIRAALKALRRRRPKALVLAVPVAPVETVAALRGDVDELVCLAMPEPFVAIGVHYLDFRQLSDEEVMSSFASLPARVEGEGSAPASTTHRPPDE
jgi:putative phosphoribosyl transferase